MLILQQESYQISGVDLQVSLALLHASPLVLRDLYLDVFLLLAFKLAEFLVIDDKHLELPFKGALVLQEGQDFRA